MLTPFSPPPGLNSDDTTFSAEGQWADGNNVRFRFGKAQTVGGTQQPSGSGSLDAESMMAFQRAGAAASVAIAGPALKLSSLTGAATTVTPASGWGAIRKATMGMFGDILLVAQTGGKLFEQSGSSLATHVTQAPGQITTMLVTPERQVLALGCNEEVSGTFNSKCIRGCDLEDYTDWTTSATNNAFEHILGMPGDIVAATMLSGYVVVWTNTGLWVGQFIGDPSQTYRFDRVGNVGCISLSGYTVLGSTVYFLSPDLRLFSFRVGEEPAEVLCPISKDFQDNFSVSDKAEVFLCAIRKYGEVRVYYPDSRDTISSSCTRYTCYCVNESALVQRPVWYRGAPPAYSGGSSGGHLRRLCMIDSPLIAANLTSQGTTVIAGTDAGTVVAEDCTTSGIVAPQDWYITSADQYFDNSSRRVMLRSVTTDFEDQSASVELALFVRDRPMGSATTKGPYTLTTSTTRKDFRASGKIVAVKLSDPSSTGAYARLGKLLFDVVPMGER